jgi:iron(III) transport system ATP-binding protein
MKKVAVNAATSAWPTARTEVLKDVNLDIEPGEFFALLGPSGSGKSTLLRLIAGFNQHQQGELLIDGVDVTGSRRGRATWAWCSRATRCGRT